MTRHEADREDLLRDATAMKQRIALRTPQGAEVFIGFRSSGATSIYLDQDPAYHFNSTGELRRAYLDGQLIKAICGRLVRMTRHRPGGEVQLVSQQLTEEQTTCLLEQLTTDLLELRDSLNEREYVIIGQVPEDGQVLAQALVWLEQQCSTATLVASAPHAR